MSLDENYEKLRRILQEAGSVVIGFSGGVDSSFLSYVAHDVLGDKALAVTAVSETLPARDIEDAKQMAAWIGIPHLLVPSTEFSDEHFVSNPKDRCYYCKKIRFTALVQMAKEKGFSWVIDGGNIDDLGDYRPGMRALEELSASVRSPMIEAGLDKATIRTLSERFHLSTWNKQSAACLASRVPYGTRLTPAILQQIDRAETFLAPLLPGSFRVRYHGSVARIEAGAEAMAVVMARRREIVAALRSFGFSYVTLDLNGYEMGSLNQEIKQEEGI